VRVKLAEPIDSLLSDLPAVSLEELDERASLLRRVDTKYVVDEQAFAELLRRIRRGHEVLEIDGRREFAYQSMYFDTPDLRCFRDHVEDRVPRFKARNRLYRDTGRCVFEVKLKLGGGETDKRQVSHPPEAADEFDDDAEQCLREALADAGYKTPDQPLDKSMRTSFTRLTLTPAGGAERTTCDVGILLERPGGGRARLRNGLLVLESKSESGESPIDGELAALGIEPVSLSKYRTGIALLASEAQDPQSRERAERLFELE
jgi:VTC domain